MPRIPHVTLLRAHKISPYLPLVVRATRDLPSAVRELRWIVEHVQTESKKKPLTLAQEKKTLLKLCRKRENHEPLQYILGSQPFGPLNILCRRGVLIPRPETEAITTHVARLVKEDRLHEAITYKRRYDPNTRLRILDLCSGTGCISLLLGHSLRRSTIVAFDISQKAVDLARINRFKTGRQYSLVKFSRGDIFQPVGLLNSTYDIIISNPPYISSRGFNKEATRSVRNWEPKQALVPPEELSRKWPDVAPEDVFYRQLLEYRKCYVMILEIGSSQQAIRVVEMALKVFGDTKRIEVWRDAPGALRNVQGARSKSIDQRWIIMGREIRLRGRGSKRAVIIYDCSWAQEHPEQVETLRSFGLHRRACEPNPPSDEKESMRFS